MFSYNFKQQLLMVILVYILPVISIRILTGTQAKQIVLSENFVWVLNHSGEVLCRYGVDLENIAGDYWRKIPGSFSSISGTR